ncbi:MAG TPA: DUF2642 domain-containing protein [Firmicutes bacterium]|jgi:hypothetical protein|uniref:DUF2642 domain-containing protein n=1 Tax=Gelria sp. Kuro-4 TaxID=2796927 RepID=UPI0019A79FA6|nr:DUF2642 domain-containing protein [Gelria sp. Kuro-4]MDI3522118.1 hypothetical protein [Bacillota bacterium]MDK2926760.1 hypothetical protein [Bacillota bacterium]BCV24327.1 hypothetical protein kuro4_11000 [Gelria sp. Kuro-4]HHV56902.1 DUF2642 domain-containing protein [Bacillota bacterium]
MTERYGPGYEAYSPADLVFNDHMRALVGQVVDAATWAGTVQGTLVDAFPDHILIQTPSARYHVRLAAIAFVRAM